jgi:alpha-tubulin suppressor-like RCC1 family protein
LTAGARLLSGPSPRAFSSPPHALRFPTGAPLYAWGYLTSDGQIYALGQNDYGAVGIDVDAAITTPTRVPGLSPVVDYSTGPFASCAVLAGGEVYCWGRRRGFLEHNDQPPVSTAVPERVVGIDDAVRVHVGSNLACALTRTRGVRCWGRVNWDRREAGATTDDPTSPPGATMELPPVRELAVGEHHACALTMNDEVYCWGANDLGQLGIARFGSDSTTPRRVLLPR